MGTGIGPIWVVGECDGKLYTIAVLGTFYNIRKKIGSGFDADSLHVHKLNVLRKINLRPVNFETKKCGTNNVSGIWEELHTLLRVKFNCRILVFDPFIGLLKAGFGSFTSYGL